ncbi:hypothetical protein [Bradyrhizobium arachidis]|uniref:hypothetical protein n=1 Tax=Bradyrhizobium arachidis TaxID=858423 RepID=UPI0011604115|nr:hypothetical protein [Bradyrhizobium arachidis]
MAEVTSLPVSAAIVAEIHPANVALKRSIASLMPPRRELKAEHRLLYDSISYGRSKLIRMQITIVRLVYGSCLLPLLRFLRL